MYLNVFNTNVMRYSHTKFKTNSKVICIIIQVYG